MRLTYVGVALMLMILFVADIATPVAVFVLAAIMGLVRPSDITLRSLLVGETMPAELLMRAMGVSRTTADSARVVGALSGAGLVAMLGAGLAYVIVCAVYLVSFALTLNVGIRKVRVLGEGKASMSPLAALKEGFAYVWSTPDVRAATLLAFLMNFAAYPIITSLLAYVAKDIYGLDQTGLGWLIASFAGGALAGSILLSTHGARIRPARTMIACAILWFACNLAFSWVQTPRIMPAAVRDRLRAKLLHGADGGPADAHRRSGFACVTGVHAGGIRASVGAAAVGAAGRAPGLQPDRHALQSGGHWRDPDDRLALARASVVSAGGRQPALREPPGGRARCGLLRGNADEGSCRRGGHLGREHRSGGGPAGADQHQSHS